MTRDGFTRRGNLGNFHVKMFNFASIFGKNQVFPKRKSVSLKKVFSFDARSSKRGAPVAYVKCGTVFNHSTEHYLIVCLERCYEKRRNIF